MDELIKILSIKKLKKIGMYSLETSAEELTVSDDIIVKFRLEKDLELTKEEYKKLKEENDKRNIFFAVCNYISYGMRSEYEIYHYLEEHEVKHSDALSIISELKDCKMIDDEALAGYILDSVIRNKKGPKVFQNKIFERHLKVDIKNYPYSEETEEEIIEEIIKKLYDKKKNLPIKKQKEQLYLKLLRDGFTGSIVERLISRVSFIDESDKTLEKEVEKLNKKYEKLPSEEKKIKIIRSLMQKGYEYSKITKVVR